MPLLLPCYAAPSVALAGHVASAICYPYAVPHATTSYTIMMMITYHYMHQYLDAVCYGYHLSYCVCYQ
jgi:hypothetical protein